MAADAQKKSARKMIKSQERIYEHGAATREMYSQKVQGQADIAQQQLRASEQARFNVTALLGKEGTYDMPRPEGPFKSPLGLRGISDPGGGRSGALLAGGGQKVTKSGTVTRADIGSPGTRGGFAGSLDWKEEGEVMDPDRITEEVAGTSGFRTMSRLTAEAEQLANRTGPLWDELNASVTGGIYAGAAAGQRQMMEQLSREMSKGGAARRQGMAIASAMRVQENINRERSKGLWASKMGLEQLRTSAITDVHNLTNSWLSNTAGLRDTFVANLNNLQTFWSQVMPANLISAQAATQQNMANNMMQADQHMMNATQAKYQAVIGGVNGIVGGLTGSGMMDKIGGGGGGGGGMM
jgi:hypothetical protein